MSIAYYPHQALSLTSYMTLDNSSPPGLSVATNLKKKKKVVYICVSEDSFEVKLCNIASTTWKLILNWLEDYRLSSSLLISLFSELV